MSSTRTDSPVKRAAGTTLIPALVAVAFVSCSIPVQAQSRLPLQIEVEYPANVSRTGGPVRLQMTFNWSGSGVFQGALQLEARNSAGEGLGTFYLDKLYLTAGEQPQEIMLPGFRVGTLDNSISLSPTLIAAGSGRRYDHSDLTVIVPSDQKRELVAAILSPGSLISKRAENDIVDALRLERLAPPEVGTDGILTKMVDWHVDDAPQDPLRYCACDIVLLPAEGLAELQPPQLEALLAWVRAGGGVCVVLNDAEFKLEQVDWLNLLAGSAEGAPAFLRDSQGRLIHELDESEENVLHRSCGLGRVVVTVGPDQAHPQAPHWPRTAAFLWRVRYEHLPHVVANGTWNHQLTLEIAKNSPQLGQTTYGQLDQAQEALASEFQPLPTIGLTGLIQRLLPDGIRLVPLSTMGLLLLGYLIAIGPLDYYVLGRLGMRKWTWCTFPAVTLLFTAFSIGLSNSSMSTTTNRRSAVVRDIAPGGVVARENRLELLFPSTTQLMSTDVGRGLFMPLLYQDFAQFTNYYDPYGMQNMPVRRAGAALYAGRMPTQSNIEQLIPQWTPQLNRMLTIPLEQPSDLPPFDWDEIPDFKSDEGRQQLRSRIQSAFDVPIVEQLRSGISGNVTAGVFHLGESHPLIGDATLVQNSENQQVLVNTRYGQQWINQPDSYLRLLSTSNQPGFLGVVSESAPTGGDRFEDLMLLDNSNPKQWLLVVMVPQGNELLIYRRLYVVEY
ncbi:MAG: hypothetical protein JNG89_11920 [Planctomycetaceae bacterium]|nr:hypothetical protein [Planctomycetaceae bacterium]